MVQQRRVCVFPAPLLPALYIVKKGQHEAPKAKNAQERFSEAGAGGVGGWQAGIRPWQIPWAIPGGVIFLLRDGVTAVEWERGRLYEE